MADDSYTMIAMQVGELMQNLPVPVSGNNLLGVIDRARISIENTTGLSVGSPYVPDRFKPALFNMVCSQVCRAKALGGTNGEVTLGDFRVSNSSNIASTEAEFYDAAAKTELASLGRAARYGRTF